MNTTLFHFINDTIRNPFLDAVMPVFSDKDYVILPAFVLIAIAFFFGRGRTRLVLIALILGLAMADWANENAAKNFFGADRPYAELERVHLHRGGEWIDYDASWYAFDNRKSHSFPSTHASNVAALAAILFFYRRKTLWATVPLALLVGLSRIYTGNHYPFDVLAGYAFGAAYGLAAVGLVFKTGARFNLRDKPYLSFQEAPPERRIFFVLLALWTIMNFVFVCLPLFSLSGDEAQYWDWSRHIQGGYYSKPPMIAYVMRMLVGAAGNKEWALRSGAVLFTSGTLALLYALTLRVARSDRAALIAALAVMAMPASWVASALMTIDPLLIFFWSAALYSFHRALQGRFAWWIVTGLALGAGRLSTYTMALLPLAFVLYLILHDRRRLRTAGPYVAFGLMLLLMSGVLYWNFVNDWISFKHTAAIGADRRWNPVRAVDHFFVFLGGQLGAASPLLFFFFVAGVYWCGRQVKASRDAALLFLSSMVVFGFYGLVAFTRKSEPNWPACAYLSAAPALGWWWVSRERPRWLARTLAAACILGACLGLAVRSTGLLYAVAGPPTPDARTDRLHLAGMSIDPDKDPTNELVGGRQLGAAVAKYYQNVPGAPFLFSDRYQLTALLAFYAPGRPHAYCLQPGTRRLNQYDLWGGWEALKGRDALFITGGDRQRAQQFVDAMVAAGGFERGEVLEIVEITRGHTVVKTFTISRLEGYTGIQGAQSEESF